MRWYLEALATTRTWSATLRMVAASPGDLIQALYHEPTAGSDGEFLAYGGDFRSPPDREFSCDGILFADRTPKPSAMVVKQLYFVTFTPSIDGTIDAVVLPAPLLTCVCVPGSLLTARLSGEKEVAATDISRVGGAIVSTAV